VLQPDRAGASPLSAGHSLLAHLTTLEEVPLDQPVARDARPRPKVDPEIGVVPLDLENFSGNHRVERPSDQEVTTPVKAERAEGDLRDGSHQR
jgi:hypothetical protein